MRPSSCIVLVAAYLTASVPLSQGREFGPEWTRVRGPNNSVIEYRKNISVPVVNYGGGSNYQIQLEFDLIQIFEHNDDKGFSLASPKYGRLSVLKNADGSPASYEVRFPPTGMPGIQYSDLNGDGIFDSMSDLRGMHRNGHILLGDRFVPVHGTAVVGVTEASSPDFKTNYIFQHGRWHIKSRAYDFNGDGQPDAIERFPPDPRDVHIHFNGKWIPVDGDRVSDSMREAVSPTGTKYRFEGGKWVEGSGERRVDPADAKREALWTALQKALPEKYRQIDVYGENDGLTSVLFRSAGQTLLFSLGSNQIEVIQHQKVVRQVNCITYASGMFTLWCNGKRELTVGAAEGE